MGAWPAFEVSLCLAQIDKRLRVRVGDRMVHENVTGFRVQPRTSPRFIVMTPQDSIPTL
jgi:hypothetical protein